MFDVIRIGKYISFLRKNSGMTQGQLAEKLGVSHQAVSNWERGEAMPDIALLTKLASVLNTTTDRILLSGEDLDIPENAPNSESKASTQAEEIPVKIEADNSTAPDEKIHESKVEVEKDLSEKEKSVKELESTINILKERLSRTKSQSAIEKLEELIDEVEGQIDELKDEMEQLQGKIEEETRESEELEELAGLEGLAGLKSLSGLKGLAGLGKVFGFKWAEGEKQKSKNEKEDFKSDKECTAGCNEAENEDSMNWQNVISIAPFASRETLEALVGKLNEKADFDKIKQLAPFLSSETLDKLISGIEGESDFSKIIGLAPFLSAATLERLILSAFNNGDNPSWEIVTRLAHFASRETLQKLISKLDERAEFDKIIQLAPCLSSETLEKMVMDAYNNGENVNWHVIRGLAPFVSGNALNLLISKFDLKKDFNKIVELAPFLGSETIDKLIKGRL